MPAPSGPGPTAAGRTGATDALHKPVGVLTFLSWHIGASVSSGLLDKLHEYATSFEVDVIALHTTSEDAPSLEGFDVVLPDRTGPVGPQGSPGAQQHHEAPTSEEGSGATGVAGERAEDGTTASGPSAPSPRVLLFKRQGIKNISLRIFDTVSASREWRSENQPPLPQESGADEDAPELTIMRRHEPPPDDDPAFPRKDMFVYTPQDKVACELWPPRLFRAIGRKPVRMLPLGDSIFFSENLALMFDIYCKSWDAPPPGFRDSGMFPKTVNAQVPTLVG